MPSFLNRSKASDRRPTISRPVPIDPPTLASYEGETPLMQVPNTPPPIPVHVPSIRTNRNEVTTSQIVDLYNRPVEAIHQRRNGRVPSSSVYSRIEYEPCRSTTFAHGERSPTVKKSQSTEIVPVPMPFFSKKPSVRFPEIETWVDGPTYYSQHNPINALNRGFSNRYPQPPRSNQTRRLPLYNQALVRPRRQGFWLTKWFEDNDPAVLKAKAEEATERKRRQAEKEAEKHEREMAKLERKMSKVERRRHTENQ